MMENQSFQRLSRSIETLRFPLILFIICLHCYTSTSNVFVGHGTFFRIIYPLSLWLGETGVPAYFFISGFLLYYSQKSYKQKLRSRVKTLLIPYLFFNSLILCGYLFLLYIGKPVIIMEKNLADYLFIDYLRAFWDRGSWSHGNGSPLLCPFWYIRNLMVLVVFSPILYYIIRNTKLLFPFIVGFWWINSHDSAYTLQSLTMFSLGAYFPICKRNLIEMFEKYKILVFCAFLFFAAMDFLHLFFSISFALPFHRLSLIANTIVIVCFFGDYMCRHQIYSPFLSKAAFFVFCVHYPLTISLRPIFVRINGFHDIVLVITYLVLVIGIALVCVVVYKVLTYILPNLINIVTGSRG